MSVALLPRLAPWVRALRPAHGWGRVLLTPTVLGGALIFPGVLLLGAAWPLLLAAGTPRVDDGGRRIGRLSLTNAIGASAGSVVAGWILIPALGAGRSLVVLAAWHAVLATAALLRIGRRTAARALAVAAAPGRGHLGLQPGCKSHQDWQGVGQPSQRKTVLYRESATGTVTVLEEAATHRRSMYVDNNAVIGTTFDALKVVRLLGLAQTLLHRDPKDVLVIGYGAGRHDRHAGRLARRRDRSGCARSSPAVVGSVAPVRVGQPRGHRLAQGQPPLR